MENTPAEVVLSIPEQGAITQATTPRRPRASPGEMNPRAVLTNDLVLAIYADQTSRTTDLAKRYGVHNNTVSMIRHGKRWAWLTTAHSTATGNDAPESDAGNDGKSGGAS